MVNIHHIKSELVNTTVAPGRKVIPEEMKEAEILAQYLNIPHTFVDQGKYNHTDCPTWDGHVLALNKHIKPWNFIHEIAHFQVCPRYRIKQKEWGLGWSPESNVRVKATVKYSTAQREEAWASLLGILWEKFMGFDYGQTLLAHNLATLVDDKVVLDETLPNRIDDILKSLYSFELINGFGVPNFNSRSRR